MAKVGAAVAAHDLRPAHTVSRIVFGGNVLLADGLVETGPTGARIKFRIRVEKLVAAGRAFVNTRLFCLVIFAREGPFRALHPANLILFWSQILFPLFFRFLNFWLHEAIVLQSVNRRLPVRCGRSPKASRTASRASLDSAVGGFQWTRIDGNGRCTNSTGR
jgi:hypothetical protein